ncbi:hypothetical protein [Mycolicibacterium helvum]|uniref:hypothetical protein n=1 Tax=Mycolicibacterium helvum TaxID=1534349 RepID=UPI0013D28272|nr:hypothetical protein [Mycolicibacterium helvum]
MGLAVSVGLVGLAVSADRGVPVASARVDQAGSVPWDSAPVVLVVLVVLVAPVSVAQALVARDSARWARSRAFCRSCARRPADRRLHLHYFGAETAGGGFRAEIAGN